MLEQRPCSDESCGVWKEQIVKGSLDYTYLAHVKRDGTNDMCLETPVTFKKNGVVVSGLKLIVVDVRGHVLVLSQGLRSFLLRHLPLWRPIKCPMTQALAA